jgi:hypothetical protein
VFFIPGWLIALITFPGVIVHEAAHRFFCDVAGVPVYRVCYFRVGNPAGYVIHGKTERLWVNFVISVGPLIVNTALCAFIGFSPVIVQDLSLSDEPFIFGVLFWLAMSIGMHSFPSGQDMENFSNSVESSGRHGVLKTAAQVLEFIFRAANALRVIWFDAIYAFAVSAAIPYVLVLL